MIPGGGVIPTISVALCTRNGERYVREQLASILQQTNPPDEVVVSDDASDDGTVAAVRESFDLHLGGGVAPGPRLRVLENAAALGVTRNFEQACLATTGDLIALSDQDDVWEPRRLETILAAFASRPTLTLVHSDAILVDGDGRELGLYLFEALGVRRSEVADIHSGDAFGVFLRRNLATGATIVFRRGLLNVATDFPTEWLHDEWLAMVAAATGEVDAVETPLVRYRQHGGNVIGARRLSLRGKFLRMVEPRAARNSRLLGNSETLVDRLVRLDDVVPPATLKSAKGKVAHERARSDLPARRIFRIVPVLRERMSGGYRQYGRGDGDVLRDLLQPAR